MYNCAVSYCAIPPDRQWKSRVGMQNAVVLNIASFTNAYQVIVAADDNAEPDAGLLRDFNIPDGR